MQCVRHGAIGGASKKREIDKVVSTSFEVKSPVSRLTGRARDYPRDIGWYLPTHSYKMFCKRAKYQGDCST